VKIIVLAIAIGAAACSPMVYTHGIPNLDRVTDNIYRSGQITTDEGWAWVNVIAGSRHVHVIKLNFDAEGLDDLAKGHGFSLHALPIDPQGDQDLYDDVRAAFRAPDPQTVDAAVALLAHASDQDFYLVHCTHGQDRTGYVIGRYRVLVQHWTKEAAYAEMIAHHFHPELHGLHEAWERLVAP
jgi:protein-tyrosine phosphatase